MPKRSVTFISGFLIPSLNDRRFGKYLKWLDKEKATFQIEWHHKGGPTWSEQEAAVFAEWDKHKGHYKPDDKLYYPKSKQRFRSLLYKLTLQGQLRKLKSDDKFRKIYCIVGEKRLRKKTSSFSDSSEYEFSNQGEEFSDNMNDALHSNEINRRMISNDSHINVLEDHTYSCTDFPQKAVSEIQEPSLYEPPSCIEKKILVERNYPYNLISTAVAERNSALVTSEKMIACEKMTYTKTSEFLQSSDNEKEQVVVPCDYLDIHYPTSFYETSDCLKEKVLVKNPYPYNELIPYGSVITNINNVLVTPESNMTHEEIMKHSESSSSLQLTDELSLDPVDVSSHFGSSNLEEKINFEMIAIFLDNSSEDQDLMNTLNPCFLIADPKEPDYSDILK